MGVAPQLKCCGVNSSADWRTFAVDGNTVPDSCCVNVTKDCGKNKMADGAVVYQKVTVEAPARASSSGLC